MSSIKVALLVALHCFSRSITALPHSSHEVVSAALPVVQAATSQTCSMYGTATLKCYEGPGSTYTAKATVKGGHFYTCSCQSAGENINGNV